MKHIFTFLFILITLFAVSQNKLNSNGKSNFQKNLNEQYTNPETSPLTKKDLKKFNGLEFYPIDNTYKVKASFERSLDENIVGFKTTTNRIASYKTYGTLYFTIKGKELKLTVYKSTSAWGNSEKYRNHLFLPYQDKTCGKTSYTGGRYIDLSILDIQQNNTLVLDFNNSYNPYCAYNNQYSCPKVPKENFLDIEIKAGVKAFKK